MALPTTEITIFDTSDLFRSNPELLEPAFKQLVAEGVDVSLYSGLEAENPNVGFIAVNWDSYKHHQEVMRAPFYAEFAKGLAPVLAGPPTVYHAQFSAPTVALDKPVTEVALLTLKTPGNRAAAVDVLSKITQATDGLFAFGPTREDGAKYIAICGWESVEAHRDALSKPESREVLNRMHSVVDVDFIYHAKLKRFERAARS